MSINEPLKCTATVTSIVLELSTSNLPDFDESCDNSIMIV